MRPLRAPLLLALALTLAGGCDSRGATKTPGPKGEKVDKPVGVDAPTTNAGDLPVELVAGGQHACVRRGSGTVECWG
ncbi:MAG: hypothetical protein KC636_08090, partial [Myxococcales bacterium]|nr:hypothetical protein [Myxococcales bacterium]